MPSFKLATSSISASERAIINESGTSHHDGQCNDLCGAREIGT